MNDNLRRALPVVAATALTASALLGGGGSALAGKPLPTANADGGQCPYYLGETRYRVNYDLTVNKGKWAFVRGGLTIGETEYPTQLADFTKWDMSHDLQLEAHVGSLPEAATMTLYFGDRKGTEIASVSAPLCN